MLGCANGRLDSGCQETLRESDQAGGGGRVWQLLGRKWSVSKETVGAPALAWGSAQGTGVFGGDRGKLPLCKAG